ncbi:hypothetical protein TraAM80_03503 [Trypanosoma rangeli]|uniref:Probable ubiquitin carboxyl-terminal hydrolase MINDY-4 n=1 Tax=Trypanosoma rangeli TaxID=5698 RepID=A0A3S5IRJ7_TRYRA|nr:uncharacterized protein TraAM80_03503 [Trypanosoma rangeli]RNF07148.1 hypothetical protein TraAM80_03503 [Trypanosoma rangeli]|eukprot:RNF07148.1 hypothetical protein TraAM80_03503 [Trypanosoma rangeli]
MPPKKGLTASAVYNLPHERQVELLSEALLREYMHKRKFTETLKTFDVEHPRDADTIASRALMSDMMALGPEMQRTLKDDGVETIVEMLCLLRVRRRLELDELKRRALLEVPQTPERLRKHSKESKKTSGKPPYDDLLHEKRSTRRRGGASKEQRRADSSFSSNGSSSSSRVSSSGGGEDDIYRSNKRVIYNRRSNIDISSESESEGERVGQGGWINKETGTTLGKGVSHAIMELVCGGNSLSSSFVELGFVFGEEVEYGLLQEHRGPEGIVAVVQAFICAYFFRGGYIDVKRHQQQCLLKALATLLFIAQPNPRRVCLADGSVTTKSAEADMARLRVLRNFATRQQVEDSLLFLLESWTQPGGSGVFCFLLSVLLSRGLKRVSAAVGRTAALIDREGRCSTSLTRLLLLGEADAVSPDDVLENLMLDEGKGRLSCGYVSSGPDDTLLDDEGAKTPQHPVWVVHHNGRFVVLFLKKDDRAQFEQRKKLGMATSDVFFYEPSAAPRGEAFLTVSLNAAAGKGRVKEQLPSFLYAAVRKIPLWRDGDIDWNGFEPTF